jgi:competence protein ComGC
MSISLLREFWEFMRERKKWWLLPILIMLLVLGLLIFLTTNPAVSPFIYTLF